MNVSVIICSHNPRPDYLTRCLAALERQSLPRQQWELLLVDNASSTRVADRFAIDWHPHGRHCVEHTVGLTAARIRGIRETRGDLLVFVDDDNVLADDYLAICVDHARSKPAIGAFGGSTEGAYEIAPPAWFLPWAAYVGDRTISTEQNASTPLQRCFPIGAGLCVRRAVADLYAERTMSDKGPVLDRVGSGFIGSGDIDLAYHSVCVGLEYGVTPRLRLDHLIAARRVELPYMERLVFGTHVGHAICEAKWGKSRPGNLPGWLGMTTAIVRERIASVVKPNIQRTLNHLAARGYATGWNIVRRQRVTALSPMSTGEKTAH